MSKLFLTFIMLFIYIMSTAQWIQVASIPFGVTCQATPNPVGAIFKSPNVGFTVYTREYCTPSNPNYFAISRTQDSWQSLQGFYGCGMGGTLYDFDSPSEDTAYISFFCGPQGNRFMKTTDAGNSWSPLPFTGISNIVYVNGHLGYCIKTDSLYRFYNDSLYFVSILSNITNATTLYFIDSLTGFIAVQSTPSPIISTLLRTGDGGLTWIPIPLDSTRVFLTYSLEALNSSVMYLKADSGYVYKTSDGGFTWLPTLKNTVVGWVHFLDEQRAYAANNTHYSISFDGGSTWSSSLLPDTFTYTYIKMFNDSVGYISTYKGSGFNYSTIILKTTHAGLGIQDMQSPVPLNLFPNPSTGNFSLVIPQNMTGEKDLVLKIFDFTGRLIQQIAIGDNVSLIKINLENHSRGIYNLILTDGKKNSLGKALIF